MNEQDYGRVIAKNIKRLAYEKNKTQADIARDLNYRTFFSSKLNIGTFDTVFSISFAFAIKKAPVFTPGHKEGGQPPEVIRSYILRSLCRTRRAH